MKNNKFISPFQKIIKDVWYYAPAKIIPGFLAFLAIIIYTRLLSPEEYGLYILAITTIAIVTAVCFEWLNKSILRYFETYKQDQRLPEFISTVIGSLLGIVTIVLVFWYFGITLLHNFLNPSLVILLNIGGLVILTQASYTFILFFRQAAQESSKYAVRSVISAITKLVIAVFLLYFFSTGPQAILWGMIISAGSIAIWDIFSFYRKWQIKISYFSKKLLKDFFRYGMPLMGVSVASFILVAADRYMIQYFLTTNDVGVYSAGYNLSNELIQFPLVILLLAAYPIIMETFEKKEKETRLLLNKILAVYFIFLAPIVFGITVLAKNITYILLGSGFQASYIILPWVSMGVFCFGLTQYFYKPFELKKQTKKLLYIVILAAVFNIILNLFLIPKFGIIGAAYATLISYFIYLFSVWLLSSQIFNWFFPWYTIAKTIIAAVIMYLMLYFIIVFQPVNIVFLIMDILLGMICYFAILLFLREKFVLQSFKYFFNYFKTNQ